MKKIILILCACLLLTGCTSYEGAEDKSEKAGGGYFTVIKEWNDNDAGVYTIVYANDTGVKYLIYDGIYKKAITPLYNADGSLQLYEESEAE